MEKCTGSNPRDPPDNETQSLRYHTRALWLLSLFVPLILIPWILTCILAIRPINAGGSYFNQKGFTPNEVSAMRSWRVTAQVLDSIAGLFTIPILSALLAQAAVVHSQRRKTEQSLSLREMFDLADRAWTDIPVLWKSLRNYEWRSAQRSGFFLLPAATLIFLGTIQQPLSQALLYDTTISITTQDDTAYMIPKALSNNNETTSYLNYIDDPRQILSLSTSKDYNWKVLANDIEPSQMARIKLDSVLPRVASSLASMYIGDAQPNLWVDYMTEKMYKDSFDGDRAIGGGIESLAPYLDSEGRFFVSALRANSTTGVLREHVMRLNSSVICKQKTFDSSFDSCSGEQKFQADFRIRSNALMRICVPGDLGTSPWTLSRNRQVIREDLFIYFPDHGNLSYFGNVGVHCAANTTRGYFELGNYRNNDIYGGIMDRWPSPGDVQEQFNDWIAVKRELPLDWDNSTEILANQRQNNSIRELHAPGPLMVSAVALFGKGSWYRNAADYVAKIAAGTEPRDQPVWWQSLCEGMPFRHLFPDVQDKQTWINPCAIAEKHALNGTFRNDDFAAAFDAWTQQFEPHFYHQADKLITTSVFVASREILTSQSQNLGSKVNTPGRIIYSSPGQQIQKPVISTSVMVILSVLKGSLLLGLAFLTWYIYRIPTWTPALNSMAIARICANLDVERSRDKRLLVSKQDMGNVLSSSGLIGIVPQRRFPEKLRIEKLLQRKGGIVIECHNIDKERGVQEIELHSHVQLGLGARGVISRASTLPM